MRTIMKKTRSQIKLNHVHYSFGENVVLKDISFSVHKGDYIGIFGQNGSGKTTLLKIMLGLLPPLSGEVMLFGGSAEKSPHHAHIGYVPQRIAKTEFHFPATVREVVLTGRTAQVGIFKRFQKKDLLAVDNAMKTTGISHLQNRRIAHLSGGERQRVFLARSLALEPKILILDEPTAGVDTSSQETFYGLLSKLNKQRGLTIIIVSHDIDMIAEDVDRILCLNESLVFHGSPEDFQEHIRDKTND